MNSGKLMRVVIGVVFVVVLVAVIVRQAGPNSVDRTGIGDPMVELAPVAAKITAVEVQTAAGNVRAERGSSGGWIITTRDGFPAKDEAIQELVRGLISLKKSQRMTSKVDRHGELGLDWSSERPSESKETRHVRVFVEGAADPAADLIIGRGVLSPAGVYARASGENQAWRCVGTMTPSTELGSWLAGPVAEIPADEIQQVECSGKTLTKSNGQWSVVGDPPVDPSPATANPADVNAAAQASSNPKHDAMKGTLPYLLSGFQPDDVRRETPKDLSRAGQVQVSIRLDADHAVDARMWKEGDGIWIRLAPGECSDAVHEKLSTFAPKWEGWVFKFPQWRSGYLSPLFESDPAIPAAPAVEPPAIPAAPAVEPGAIPAVPGVPQ